MDIMVKNNYQYKQFLTRTCVHSTLPFHFVFPYNRSFPSLYFLTFPSLPSVSFPLSPFPFLLFFPHLVISSIYSFPFLPSICFLALLPYFYLFLITYPPIFTSYFFLSIFRFVFIQRFICLLFYYFLAQFSLLFVFFILFLLLYGFNCGNRITKIVS